MATDSAALAGFPKTPSEDDAFFGNGETGNRLREIDWSKKSIGAVATWPQSLRTALSIGLSSPQPVCIMWGRHKLCFCNDAFVTELGQQWAEKWGEGFSEVWPADWTARIALVLESVEQTGRGSSCDNLVLVHPRDGRDEEWHGSVSFAPIRVEGGAVGGIFAQVTDSKWKDVDEALSDTLVEPGYREAADNAPFLMWTAEVDHRRTWFNRRWLELVGRTLEQERGEGWTDNIHPEDRSRCVETYRRAIARREVFSVEYRLRRHDGEFRWLLDNGVPAFRGQQLEGFRGFCIDITDLRAAEAAMNESRNAERARRQELEVLTQIAPAGIWMAHDPDCHHITANAAAHAMIRVPPGCNLSRSAAAENTASVKFLHEGKPIATEDLAMRVAARTGQTVMNQELEFRFPDGTSTWVYGSATPLIGEEGKVRGVVCVMVDVTEWKRVEAALRFSENQLRLITDHTAVMMAQLDRNHRYRFVNRTYCERYQRPLHELMGSHVSEVIGQGPYETAKPYLAKALEGEPTQFELYYPQFSRWGHVVYEPERAGDGTILGLVAVVIDITQRKQAEIELQRARDEALAASRAKDDFLAALSHELRTPLSPVLLLASESAADAKLPARVRKDFATIRKCVELEARLIDDLLDLTRITRGKLALERAKLDLAVVLQDALSTIRADLDQKQIELVVEDIPDFVWVWGDPVRLQQVFWNVLKNAVKFTPWGGRVSVGSRIDPAKETIVIEVTDSGIGITPAELARVFEAFSQGDHANTGGSHRFGGLGLGLAISRRVVELHDGKITAESAGRDHGATFRVELPLFDSASTKAVQDTTTSSSNESHVVKQRAATMQFESAIDGQVVTRKRPAALLGRILLVEDHAPTRIALEQLLIRRNYAVRSAASVADARELAKREKFAILISDIGLPDGSGYDLMSEFRKAYGMVGVSLTGYGTEEDVSRSQSAGFVRHLTKPIRMQSLDEALANLPLVVKAN